MESGVFQTKEDALEVADTIAEMVADIMGYAEHSTKSKTEENNYQLYKSDVVIGTNCIHVDIGEANYAFISFNTFFSTFYFFSTK